MSRREKDYSDYIKHMSNLVSGMFFIGGILLTVITLLLTQLPNPSTLMSQLVLFFLLVGFNLTGFLATYLTIDVIYLCKDIPPYSSKYRIINMLMFVVATFWGLSVTLLFVLFNLTYLALASLVVWTLTFTANYFLMWKPVQKFRKTTYHSEN